MAQKKVDLSAIQFNENPDALLKGIPYDKISEKGADHYEIKNSKNCPYYGAVMEESVIIGAFNHQVISYSAITNLTANTNRVLNAILATYHQPTKKLATNGDTRAWYWQTPTLFIQLMTTEVGFHDKRSKQVACTVKIVTLNGLKTGAEPDLAVVYKVFSTYKI
jgi:hypothetical protein